MGGAERAVVKTIGWPVSLLIGFLSAGIGAVASGLVAGLVVEWFHITSFEGASGYFIVGMALLGFVASLIVGVVTCRRMAAGDDPDPWRAFAVAHGLTLGTIAAIGLVARILSMAS